MKFFKFSLCVLLSALLIFSCAAVVHASDSYLALYGFSFTVNNNNEATIHEYDDRSPNVAIPGTLLGARVVCIDDYAFFGDTSITSLSFDDAQYLRTIGTNAFYGCSSLTELTIPPNVEMSYGTFRDCSGLNTLNLLDGITAIPEQCFYNCGSLSEISIPSSVTEIGELAFGNCRSLTSINVPDTVQSIGANAFSGCDDLVIYCTFDSYVKQYAIDNDIDYFVTDARQISYIKGDVDGDGFVTINDVTLTQLFLAQIESDPFNQNAADVDGNGLDIIDTTNIQRYLAEYADQYGIGETVIIFVPYS